jgi:hypothetical protein
VIGPILFLILIGDIDQNVVHAFLSCWESYQICGRCSLLQQDLNQVYQWAALNNIEFNEPKFDLLRYGRNIELKDGTSYVTDSNTPIEEKQMTKDLGVIMSNSGDFNGHISKVTETVRDLSSWILRSFKSRSPTLMLQLWKSIVIPHLDYCSQLWNPHKVSAIQQLEELQKSFVQHISGFRHMNYWTALAKLGLYSLQRRRERYQIIYLWSILESKVPNIFTAAGLPMITTQSAANTRRGRTIHIPPVKSSSYSTLRYHSLPIHGSRIFNVMPPELRNLSNVSKDTFKFSLDKILKCIPDEPLILRYTQFRQAPTNSILDMANCTSGWEESVLTRGY